MTQGRRLDDDKAILLPGAVVRSGGRRRRRDQGRHAVEDRADGRQGTGARHAARLVCRRSADAAGSGRASLAGIGTRDATGRQEARLLSFARVPDWAAVLRCARQHGADGQVRGSACATSASTCAISPRPSRTQRSATAGSAGSRPASWTAWRALPSRRRATASAMNTACSGSSSPRAGRRSFPSSGWNPATRGSSSAPTSSTIFTTAATSFASIGPTAPRGSSGFRTKPSRPSPSIRRSSAGADGTSTRCGSGRRARSIR